MAKRKVNTKTTPAKKTTASKKKTTTSSRTKNGQFTAGNTEGFAGNPQNINKKGRPRKAYARFAEKYGIVGYTKSEIVEAYGVVAAMTEIQLKLVLKDTEADILIKTVCRAFEYAKAKGNYNKIKEITEMISGKPTSSQRLVDDSGKDLIPDIKIERVKIEIQEPHSRTKSKK